jgi:hypothetical protein
MASDARSCPLLRLPRELRYQIYDHLCHQESKSYPFNQLPISSIDQTGPPTALLVTCRYLYEEIHTYFMRKVTLGFIPLNSGGSLSHGMDPMQLNVIQEARKVAVILDWQRHPQADEPNIPRPYRSYGWVKDLVGLLLDESKSLEVITLSVVEPGRGIDWEQKEMALTFLKTFAGRVRFRLGDVITEDEKMVELKEWLGLYLKELNTVALPAVSS